MWVCGLGRGADDSSSSSEPELVSAAARRRARKQKGPRGHGTDREPFRQSAGTSTSQSSTELQHRRHRKRKLKPTSEWITALADAESSASPSSVWEHRGKALRKSYPSDQAENIQQVTPPLANLNTRTAIVGDVSASPQSRGAEQHTTHLLKKTLPTRVNGAALNGVDWLRAFKPQSVKDLGVHAKKKAELAAWFERARREYGRQPGRQKLLVISGPPGCGKSASLEVCAWLLQSKRTRARRFCIVN